PPSISFDMELGLVLRFLRESAQFMTLEREPREMVVEAQPAMIVGPEPVSTVRTPANEVF
ncbi:hypothetical protein, partial [Allomesorhizobium alhagi]